MAVGLDGSSSTSPVQLGDGMRLFDPSDTFGHDGIELTSWVVETPEVTHIRYAVDGRAPLAGDERVAASFPEAS